MSDQNNPFAALIEEPIRIKPSNKPINQVLEEIFAFTLEATTNEQKGLLYLGEVAESLNRKDLDLQIIQHALFDRLFLCNDENSIITNQNTTATTNSHARETKVIKYLYDCYQRISDSIDLTHDEIVSLKGLIVRNTATALIQSDIYNGQKLDQQFADILKERPQYCDSFFMDVCEGIRQDDDGGVECLKQKLNELILEVTREISKTFLITFDYDLFNVFHIFTTEEYLAEIFLDVRPEKFSVGVDYAHTPLGALLNISILPKTSSANYEHFQNPFDQVGNVNMEGLLWTKIDKISQHIHNLILNLIKCSPKIKNKVLQWIGDCLKMNNDRRKLWNAQTLPELNPASYTNVTDGFMINLGNILLRLCQPFCSSLNDKKILKVDPTYCAVTNERLGEKGIHLWNMSEETCLIPKEGEDERRLISEDAYNFITECFYLTQKAINIGYQVTVDKFFRLNNEVARMERAYNDALQQAAGNRDFIDSIKQRMTQQLTKYLSIKCTLSDPIFLGLMFDLTSSTTYWLCQVAQHTQFEDIRTYAPLNEIPLNFPLSTTVPDTLKYIPEFIIENIVCYLGFLRRFNPKIFEEQGFEKMEPILSFILIYMGSPERMKNPHLRATLAEALESLLPHHNEENPALNLFGGFQRELLFTRYEHRNQIISSLLHVFVGIEMTGQSVEFEQKFNYRRPMYAVIDYLWTMNEYQNYFKNLAEEAERCIDAVTPPIYLRFVNLLMNDAVFLLDEALANMAKLKEMQTAKENGEWDNLPPQERAQNLGYMHHIGNIAKFDNILGRDTIRTMEKLTSKITTVFTHATMVDRVAAMLNYFLYNLVGPNKKNFKVKDQKEYSFDPAGTVLNICKIYVNLKNSDSFCLAISQDGRSYSPQLFTLAEDVLVRIGGGILIGELKEVAEKVANKSEEQQANEEAIAEAPEHFLDPIMSTLMTDPVILPSSKQTVDRTTIARHLLSDQTDPFNRAPLSMDQVIPNVELAEEIKNWIQDRKNKTV